LSDALALRDAERSSKPADLLSASPADMVDRRGGNAGFLGDKPVLFFYRCARGSFAVETAKHLAWNSAIGSLGAVFVDDVEHDEFGAGRWLSSHFSVSRGG
jgi:hypothetical protein